MVNELEGSCLRYVHRFCSLNVGGGIELSTVLSDGKGPGDYEMVWSRMGYSQTLLEFYPFSPIKLERCLALSADDAGC